MFYVAKVSEFEVVLFGLFIIVFFLALFFYSFYFYWIRAKEIAVSPYTNKPLRFGSDIPLSSVEKVMRFLHYEIGGYDNRVFAMRKAMICRETGRIFQDVLTWTGRHKVDWSFITKRYPGQFVSWGSLTEEQKAEIYDIHLSLEGFQTENSCPHPSPRSITSEYAKVKPGPLYVDTNTYVLLGWKCVPDTSFEVLVVQKPLPALKPKDRILKNPKKTSRKDNV